MQIKMRNLQFQDVFTMSKIIKKTGIKNEVKDIFIDTENRTGKHNNEITQEQGLQLSLLLFENLHYAEDEIFEFLTDLSGIKSEKLKKLSIGETIELFKAFGKLEGLENFFASAAKLMK